ncbi:MAG: SprB repeat-containing protein, partial [Saprospiraceae bacterium]|nr:SprB repeat-containing protein [Saprospiraceae bacterium]
MKRLIIVTMAMLYFGLAFGKMGEELADPFYFKCPLNITNIDSQDPTDCNINNGVIEIEVTGGNGSYEYSVNDGASWQSSNRFQDLPAGTFLIKVRQTDGACESSGSEVVNLQGPDSPRFIAVNSTPPTDCGLADGTITIEARGGTGPYGYSIDGGETWVAAKFFQSLAAGTYQAMVRNADGTCETPYIFPIELIGPTPPEISGVDFSPITDCDREDASIRIQTENSGDFLYSIDGRTSWQQEAAFNDLAAGRFDIWVSNSNGSCPINYGPVTIPALAPPSIEGVLVNPTSDCGQQDASIQVIADGSYEYQLEQGNWQTSSEFPALSAGNYTIKVRNVDGTCLQILPEEVIDARVAPEIREVSFQPPSDCGLSDGQIEVEASAGDGAISYSFDGGASWGSIAVASNLPSGTYEVRLRNENGSCVQTYPLIELEGPMPPVIANIVDIAPSSCNGTNGFIAIQTEETGLEYSIDGGQTWGGGNQFANLRAGNYQPMVRRTTGNCESTGRLIQLEDPPTPALLGVETSNPSDCSLNDGVIFVQASSSIPLEYSIDGGSTWSSNPRFQNLAGGRFLVQVRNGNQSCSVAGPLINLTAPTAPEVELSLAGPSSCGGADGRIDLASLSGEALEYSLNNGQSWQTQASFNGLTEGAYVLRFRKLDGTCEQQYPLSIELNPPALPAFEIFADSPTDCGSSDGLIWVEVEGNPDMEYSLDGGLTFQESPRFPNLTSDIYDLVLRDKTTNCRTEFAEEVRLIGPTLPPLEVEIRHPSICDGRDGLILAGPVDGGQGRYQYSINGGQSWSNYGAFPNLRPGVYQIMARNADGSCVRSWSEEAVLEEAPLPDFSVETIQPIVCDEANGEIQIILSNEEEDIEFSLDGGESWQEQAKFEQLRQGNYQLLLRIAGRPCEFGAQEIVLNNAIQPLEPELLIAQPTACGEPNGRISLGEVPINDTWEYSINGGVDWTRNPAWNNLVVGTYQFQARNLQYPCLATTERIISLTTTESPSILAVDIQQAAGCEEGGSIRFQLEGEETDYLYSIDGGINWQASPLFDSLSVGQYQLSVQDMEGQCQAIYQGNSEIKHPILAQVAGVETIPPAACGSTDGEIHILLAEETNNLSFSIDGGISWQPEPSFQALAAGIYEVLVQGEELDCAPIPLQFDLAITIDPLDVEIEATPVSDCQQEDGRIEIVFDAAADVSFRLADGDWQDQPVFENLGANVYAIEIRNNENECIALLNGTFDLAPADLSAPEADWENPSFCGAVDGSIRITVDDEAPLEFSIDGGNTWQLEPNFTGLGADSYQVLVRRLGSQCQPERYPGLITLHDDERIPELEALLTPPTDCITEDGSIRINSAAGNGLSFSLNGGAWTTEANFEGLAQGTFTLAIRYAQGSCQLSQSETYTLEANEELPEPNLTVEAISDCGTVDGRISFEELSDNLQYSIDGGLSWQTSPTFSRLPAGNYLPRIQSEDGACTNLDMAPIVVPNPTPIPLARINSRDPSACLQADGHIEFELSSPSADYRYSIDNGETWQRSPSFEDLGPGRYQPVVRRINSDCELQSFWVDLELIEIPTIQEVKVSPASNCSANDGRIEITASGNGPISYSIDAGQTWSTSPIFDELVSTNYIVAVMVEGACPNFYQESVR